MEVVKIHHQITKPKPQVKYRNNHEIMTMLAELFIQPNTSALTSMLSLGFDASVDLGSTNAL